MLMLTPEIGRLKENIQTAKFSLDNLNLLFIRISIEIPNTGLGINF